METRTNPTITTTTFVDPNEFQPDGYQLAGTAFYEDIPVSAIWMAFEQESLTLEIFIQSDEFYEAGCECELDWNCPLHQGGPSAIERRNDEYASQQTEIDRIGYGF